MNQLEDIEKELQALRKEVMRLRTQVGIDRNFSMSEVMEITGYSRDTIDRAKDDGELPFEKCGRRVSFRASDVQAWRNTMYIVKRKKRAA